MSALTVRSVQRLLHELSSDHVTVYCTRSYMYQKNVIYEVENSISPYLIFPVVYPQLQAPCSQYVISAATELGNINFDYSKVL